MRPFTGYAICLYTLYEVENRIVQGRPDQDGD